jgi:hypothetical protein
MISSMRKPPTPFSIRAVGSYWTRNRLFVSFGGDGESADWHFRGLSAMIASEPGA